jgi:Acyl-CoA reductase (LuxC)
VSGGNLIERVQAVAIAAKPFPWLGDLSKEKILAWVELELPGFSESAKRKYGERQVIAEPLSPILHILSGNTPHAALQTLIRGILVGSNNILKLPEDDLPELGEFIQRLPDELKPLIGRVLEPAWFADAEAVVVFGSDETVNYFQQRIRPWQRFLAHGHKISFGLIAGSFAQDVIQGAARDVCVFDQLGCLSPQFYFVAEDAKGFAERLAAELSKVVPSLRSRNDEIAATLRTYREEWKFRAATEAGVMIWESPNSLDWLVIYDPSSRPEHNPLHRTVLVKPMPKSLEQSLAPIRRHISTIGVYPSDPDTTALAVKLGAQRVCSIGRMQDPSLTWHHDGWPSLASLIRYVDVEG